MQQKKKAKTKGNGVALEVVNEDFNEFKQFKAQDFERLKKLAMLQEEANQRRKRQSKDKWRQTKGKMRQTK